MNKQARKIFPLPIVATVLLVAGFVAIWFFQTQREKTYQKEMLASEAQRVELEINETLKQTSRALTRYAARVEYLGTKDKTYLDLDSLAYLEQLPILKRIGLIDKNNRVYWSYPHELGHQVEGFDQGQDKNRLEALEQARDTRTPALSKVITLRSGGLGFLLPVALFPKGKFDGFVYATVRAESLFHSFVPTGNFQVAIYEHGNLVFKSQVEGELVEEMTSSHAMNLDKSQWEVRITPTQAFLSDGRSDLPFAILVAGISISLVIGGLLQKLFQSHQEFHQANERLSRVIEATGEGVWERAYAPGGAIRYLDAQAKRIFGLNPSDNPTYEEIAALIDPRDRATVANALKDHVENKTPGFSLEFRMQKKSGGHFWIRARGRVVNRPNDVPLLVSTVQDATSEIERREQLHHALAAAQEATRAKSDFLANMSHEIRTPLNGVIGMTGLLLDRELGTTEREYAENIRGSAEILLTLINDILDFSKIEARKLDLERIDFNIERVIHSMKRLMDGSAKQKGLALTQNVPPELASRAFKGDPTRIGQVLANLIGNAVKFTEHGRITISAAEVHTSVIPGKTLLRIEVTDTGIGIPQSTLARMFQPFSQADSSTTRRYGGTGLGLSICKHLAELMGGQIGVVSQENQGSTFWFTVMLENSDAPVQTAGPAQPAPLLTSAQKFRVLLADDNPTNQIVGRKMLEKNGFRVDVVGNGLEVLTALETVPYDVILMDCQMPELDGYEASKRIRASGNTIPIIALTANAMAGDRERCLQAGMNDYVPKPININELLAALHRTLNEKAA